MLKRILGAALALCVVFTGCSTGQEKQEPSRAMGRYVEEELPGPEGAGTSFWSRTVLRKDGKLQYITYSSDGSKLVSYLRDQDGAWEQSDFWDFKLEESTSIADIAAGSDGIFYVAIRSENGNFALYRYKDGGKPEEIAMSGWKNAEEKPETSEDKPKVAIFGQTSDGIVSTGEITDHLYGLDVLESGNILATFMEKGLVEYDATGKELRKYGSLEIASSCVGGGRFYYQNYEGKINWIELSSQGGSGNAPALPEGSGASGGSMLAADSSGTLYYGGQSGIFRLGKDGSIWETLADGNSLMAGMPSMNLSYFGPDGKDGFYLMMNDSESKVRLTRCYYSSDTPTEPDTELTVYALKDSRTVRQAIGSFRQSHPNVVVNFRVGITDETSASVSDVVRALNTELLAGDGPDILILDGLPVESYLEKGVLADLKEMADSLALLDNVQNSFIRDGKLGAIPSRFSVPMLYGAQSDLDGVNSFADFNNKSEKPLLQVNDAKDLLNSLAPVCGSAWISDNKINENAIREFISTSKVLWDQMDHSGGGGGMFVTMSTTASSDSFEISPTLYSYQSGNSLLGYQQVKSFGQLIYPLQNTMRIAGRAKDGDAKPEEPAPAAMKPMLGQIESAFIPAVSVGVNAAGKQRELSMEFVKAMLSPEVQGISLGDGLPVLKSSLETLLEKTKKNALESQQPLPEMNQDFIKEFSSLKNPVIIDSVVQDAVITHGYACLNGEKSVDQAVKDIVTETKRYLTE